MSRWWRINNDMLDAYVVQSLPAFVFKQKFLEALAGAENEFSPFLRSYSGRPNQSEWAELRSFVLGIIYLTPSPFLTRFCP